MFASCLSIPVCARTQWWCPFLFREGGRLPVVTLGLAKALHHCSVFVSVVCSLFLRWRVSFRIGICCPANWLFLSLYSHLSDTDKLLDHSRGFPQTCLIRRSALLFNTCNQAVNNFRESVTSDRWHPSILARASKWAARHTRDVAIQTGRIFRVN